MADLAIRRTGNIFSIASSEFEVTYPDGFVGRIWSPPWHDLEPEDEERQALQVATQWFLEGRHRDADVKGSLDG